MTNPEAVNDFIDNFLAHADRVYDPVKAREYYLRTRELKGRKKGAQVVPAKNPPKGVPQRLVDPKSRRQKIASVTERATSTLGPKRSAKVASLSDDAKKELTKITEELTAWAAAQKKATLEASAKITKDMESKIQALPLLPRNAGPAIREQRAKNIAKIRGEGAAAQAALTKSDAQAYEKKRVAVQVEKNKVVDTLKASVKAVSAQADKKPTSSSSTATGR